MRMPVIIWPAVLLVTASAYAQSGIDPAHKFSWQENCGWMNWADGMNGSGVSLGPTFLSGVIWCENTGWVNVGHTPADGHHYANTSHADYGLNLDPATGVLSGMAWGENVGWLNFDGGALASPPNPARIDAAASRFRGYAWGENVGWVNLDDAVSYVGVVTLVTIASANPPRADENPYVSGQPFRDVLDTGTGDTLIAGIGGQDTSPQGPIHYSHIEVTFSGTPATIPSPANVSISCTGGQCPSVTTVAGNGPGPYMIELSGVIPPLHCTTFTFAATTPGQRLQYQSLPGDTNLSGDVNTLDLLWLVQRLRDGTANQRSNLARYDIDRSVGNSPVNTLDLLRLVQLLNGTNTTQPFNGATVAACP